MKVQNILVGLVFVAISCSSAPKQGVVSMKLNDNVAHVNIPESDVSVGDQFDLYRNVCVGVGVSGETKQDRSCEKKAYGTGEITEVLNRDYSVIKFAEGVKFSEGDLIEKRVY